MIYEAHPYYDQGLTDVDRFAAFGFLADRFPVYAGEWGLTLTDDSAACRAVPKEPGSADPVVFQTLSYFERQAISWTAVAFEPGKLIRNFTSYAATLLDRAWTCGQVSNPQPGMGQFLLLWLTGDLEGFGTLALELIASAARRSRGTGCAPERSFRFTGKQLGPDPGVSGRFDETGAVATLVGDTRVLFDGVPAPIFFAGPFQINLQAPYTVAGKDGTVVQAFYKNVSSNAIRVPVIPTAPELFTMLGATQAVALTQDGRINTALNPAESGSLVVLYATGGGEMTPARVTGMPVQAPYARPTLPVGLIIGGAPAEIFYAGEAPGFVGLMQINDVAQALVPAAPELVSARGCEIS